MSTPQRVVAFVVALGAVFALALGVGRLAGPSDGSTAQADGAHASDSGHDDPGAGAPASSGRDASDVPAEADAVGGLATTRDGYTLTLTQQRVQAGTRTFSFTVTGPDGAPVTAYSAQDERDLDLVVVRRDLVGFQQLAPTLDAATGRWTAQAVLTPGVWRVIAGFDPDGGDPQVLGDDLLVPGLFAPVTLPETDKPTTTVDGYDVAIDGTLVPGEESALTLSVSQAGVPVTDLDPYLGGHGHLVALRAGDLGSLDVQAVAAPDSAAGPAGPDLAFDADVPTPGTYRIFLAFSHLGVVHTAAFTMTAADD